MTDDPGAAASGSTARSEARGRAGVYGRIFTNFVHDMSTGAWAACLVVIWTISAGPRDIPAEALSVLSAATRNVFWLLVVSLIGLAVTGGVRLFYWRSQATPEELEAKRTALIWKHIAFLLVYGVGSVWAWTVAFG